MEKEKTYNDLFDFVEDKCNFRKDKKGKFVWNCNGKLRFVEEFFILNKINKQIQENVIAKLKKCGGYCDCEVIFNCMDNIDKNMLIK